MEDMPAIVTKTICKYEVFTNEYSGFASRPTRFTLQMLTQAAPVLSKQTLPVAWSGPRYCRKPASSHSYSAGLKACGYPCGSRLAGDEASPGNTALPPCPEAPMPTPNPKSQASALRIGGLQPLTTLDYPDHLACAVFCQGCAWHCRYCHNPELTLRRTEPGVPWHDVTDLLDRRQELLQAVVFSGGEATLQPALPAAMRAVRERGFKQKRHTFR
ncbi:hypothetical protein KU43P_50110 [Pseudomonas sp. KU43P]|nr:hypothetical protein KU43P_50110 [Pseudomonas sp. KU43P]